MTFQGFGFPDQNNSCLANTTFPLLPLELSHWQVLTLFLGMVNVNQSGHTRGCSFGIHTWCISVSLWSPFVLTERICLQQPPGLSSAPPAFPPVIKQLAGGVIKTWCWTPYFSTVSGRGSLGCNLQWIINIRKVQHWKSILCSKVCWYMLLWYFNC